MGQRPGLGEGKMETVCVYRGVPDGNGDQQEGKFDVNTQNVCRASGGNWREQGHRGNSSKAVVRSLWRRSERKKEYCGRGKNILLGEYTFWNLYIFSPTM